MTCARASAKEPTPTLRDASAALEAAQADEAAAIAALEAAQRVYERGPVLDHALAVENAERALRGARDRLRDAEARYKRRTLGIPVADRGVLDERAMRAARERAIAPITVAPGAHVELDGQLYIAGDVIEPGLLNWSQVEELQRRQILIVLTPADLDARKRPRLAHHTHAAIVSISSGTPRGIIAAGETLAASDVGGDKQLASLLERRLVRALDAEVPTPPSAA